MSGLKKQTFVIVCNCLILTVLDLFMPCVVVVLLLLLLLLLLMLMMMIVVRFEGKIDVRITPTSCSFLF